MTSDELSATPPGPGRKVGEIDDAKYDDRAATYSGIPRLMASGLTLSISPARFYNRTGVGEGCAMLRAVVALLVLLVPSVAQAEGRFALLIGNQGYSATVGTLKNPFNDIAVVGDALSRQGFEVLPPIKDAKRTAILGGVRDLVRPMPPVGG